MSVDDVPTSYERAELTRALQAGRDTSAPVEVVYFFSTQGVEPVAAAVMLRDGGMRVVVDEEISGDGYWHIAAFKEAMLTPSAIHQANIDMERIAAQTRVHYNGWRVSLTIGEGG